MYKKSICLVDDERNMRDLIKSCIFSNFIDINVVEARSGQEAAAMAQLQKFDLLITDLKMPGMSGQSLIKHLYRLGRSYRPNNILIVSSYAEEFFKKDNDSEGAMEVKFLPKPFGLKELIGSISTILSVSPSNVKQTKIDIPVTNIITRSVNNTFKILMNVKMEKEKAWVYDGIDINIDTNETKIETCGLIVNNKFKCHLCVKYSEEFYINANKYFFKDRSSDGFMKSTEIGQYLFKEIMETLEFELKSLGYKAIQSGVYRTTYIDPLMSYSLGENDIHIKYNSSFGPFHLSMRIKRP